VLHIRHAARVLQAANNGKCSHEGMVDGGEEGRGTYALSAFIICLAINNVLTRCNRAVGILHRKNKRAMA
jgi:hypothetical protein